MGKKSFKKKVNVFKGESNPFNVKVNREKHFILRKSVKGTKGLPVASRGESREKRKQLWQKTKVKFHKANHFVDKRKMDGSTTAEEFIASRLVKERKRKLKRNIFNLNETEELTHLGQSLQDITSFDDKGSASEDDEPLNADYIKNAHFGGFEVDHKEQPKSHKEIIQQLITDSKIKKHEMKQEREMTVNMTEKLDKDWKDMLSVISGIKTSNPVDAPDKSDPYDVIAKELMYEKKAAPSRRIKSKEELEKEEKERLDKLEQERQVRMMDESETKPRKASDHMSADSLCDDFDFEKDYSYNETPVEAAAHLSESEYSDSDESIDSQESEQLNGTADVLSEPRQNDPFPVDEVENTSGIPLTLKEFEDLVSSCHDSPDEISNVIEEILKNKLRTKSKNLLSKFDVFFGILMEYAVKCLETNMKITEILPAHLHALAEASPLNTAVKFLSYLDKEHKELKCQKKRSNFPRLKTMLILKYCSVLYSVSDFRHPVVTPAMVFMCDVLSTDCFMTFQTIASRLLVCSVISDCISQSKCFVPEAVYYLHKVLKLAIADPSKDTSQIKKKDIDLVLTEKSTLTEIEEISLLDCGDSICNDAKKLSLISQVVHQLQKFSVLYRDLPSYLELFSPVVSTCSQLPTDWYPTDLQASIQNLKQSLESKPSSLSYLVYRNTKPKPLKLFEPSFESKFSDKDDINKKFKMIKKVSQSIRKEEKGLLREMRRDVQMIAAEKLRETMESDAERKRKVKELYHDLSVQEGEFKKMMKKKP